jgi:hypothetical protein
MNDGFITEEQAKQLIADYFRSEGFTKPKLTDTPTDDLQVVNRGYVTLNGTTANRTRASVLGQFYYDTTIGKPVWWNGSTFKDAAGNTV